ncbi:hypothetical protein PRIPAC_81189 [Pristionchus pacificus]|uniref:Uncharacterized protein n=1 Tax=Pristionchus pacificus TaxID=54126 RepID=A0A2A6CJP2_PRIPA|nr:hypothetical protein PRIPAC_81189 [Pristionchus pacificus]|eukprot:PDM78422.1 hypothetical protein PRIPAC_31001 [Pristionchus pacificus]
MTDKLRFIYILHATHIIPMQLQCRKYFGNEYYDHQIGGDGLSIGNITHSAYTPQVQSNYDLSWIDSRGPHFLHVPSWDVQVGCVFADMIHAPSTSKFTLN